MFFTLKLVIIFVLFYLVSQEGTNNKELDLKLGKVLCQRKSTRSMGMAHLLIIH